MQGPEENGDGEVKPHMAAAALDELGDIGHWKTIKNLRADQPRPYLSTSMLVITSAGVLLVFAFRAISKVQVEFLSDGFRVRGCLDLNDGRKIIAFRNDLIRDQFIALFGETQLRGGRAIAEGYGDDLFAGGDDLHVVVDKTDLDLVVLVHKELSMGFDFRDQFATGWARFGMIMVMIVFFFFGSADGERQTECVDGEGDQGEFHFLTLFWFLVLYQSDAR